MNQTTVGRVLTWLADATGKDVTCDRPAMVQLLNDVRQLAYSNGQVLQRAKPSYLCVPVQCFCAECDPGYCGCSGSGATWPGITLPQWMLQPTVLFRQGVSMPYVTRWTSYEADPTATARQEFTFQDMGDTYVLERDPGCTDPFVLQIMATRCGNLQSVTGSQSVTDPQSVTVSYTDDLGKSVTEAIPLKQGQWTTSSHKVRSLMPAGVRLPLDLRGLIKVRASGVDVAQWDPGMDVPAFRRVRLTGSCACGQGQSIAVKGVRRFTRLWDDHDIVEHDNRMAWAAGADFVRTVGQSKMDQAEIANAMFKRNLFDGFMESEAAAQDTGHRRRLPISRTLNQPNRFGI